MGFQPQIRPRTHWIEHHACPSTYRRAACVATAVVAFAFAAPASKAASDKAPTNQELQQQVDTLKQQLSNLQAQQDDMIKMLAQIKDLAQGKPAAPDPTPTPPAAPANPVAALSVGNLQVEGPSTAKVAMVEFTDFECSYCGNYARNVYPQIYANYVKFGKIRYYYHPMPLPIHSHSVQAAEAAQCAADQGHFWDMHDSLFANQNALAEKDFLGRAQELGLNVDKFSQCMLDDKYSATLKSDEADWEKKGVAGTPTFMIGTVTSDGVLKVDYTINGAMGYDVYQKDLDAELAKG